MKTEFKERLQQLLSPLLFEENKSFTLNENGKRRVEEKAEEITQLSLDVVLKAIGEDEKGSSLMKIPMPNGYGVSFVSIDYQAIRNYLHSEIKAKVFAELGIKEK